LAIRALLPEIADEVQASLDNLIAPIQMELGINWCENINLSAPLKRGLSSQPSNSVRRVERLIPYQ
jgi:hypothetical protein